MPWYEWVIFILVIGTIVSAWLALRRGEKIKLTPQQKQRIQQRNEQWDKEDEEFRG